MSLPVVLVTGFLGSGKTTFLRRLAEAHPDWRMAFLVNELADADVDGQTLAVAGTPTQSVVGGSLFCECKAADFVKVLRERVIAEHRVQPWDAVVIETSGTANPGAIGRLLDLHHLADDLQVQRIVTVVAPRSFLKLAKNLPVVADQISASDLIVVNKADTADDQTLASVEHAIRELNDKAQIVRAEYCRFDFEMKPAASELPASELTTRQANPFVAETIGLERPVPHDALLGWIENLPPTILRVKGDVQTDRGWFHLEKTIDSEALSPSHDGPRSELVVIAHSAASPALEAVRQQLGSIQI